MGEEPKKVEPASQEDIRRDLRLIREQFPRISNWKVSYNESLQAFVANCEGCSVNIELINSKASGLLASLHAVEAILSLGTKCTVEVDA